LLLLIALVTVLIAGALASRLKLKTAFGELLPQGKESVIVAAQVEERLVSASTLTIVAQSEDGLALEHFVDALAPEIKSLGPDVVGNVDSGVRASRAFFGEHRMLYAPLDDIKRAHDEIVSRYEYEVSKANGTDLGFEDPPPPLTADTIKKRLQPAANAEKQADEQYPDGYYMEKGKKLICLLVRTPVSSGDVDRATEFRAKINAAIAKVDPHRFDPAMKIDFTGDFITSQEEYDQIKTDLSHVGVAGVLLVFGVVFFFYLRVRTLVAMGAAVAIGVAWTFGFAYLSVGHLNSSTGFLVSIVVGNGINFGIIYMARYLEARRDETMENALAIARRETWLSTLAAAAAATVAYGSLVVTDFRGFKHFGLIGGAGMILCWVATYLFLPAILAAMERIAPVRHDNASTSITARLALKIRGAYGRPFAWLALHAPRAVALSGAVVGLIALYLAVGYVRGGPMEYDMWNVRSESPEVVSVARKLYDRVDPVIGRQGQEGVAIMTDRVDQVLPLKTALDAVRAKAPDANKPFDRVVTIFDLLPSDQDAKIPLLEEAIDKLERAHRRGLVSAEDWTEIEKNLPKRVADAAGALHIQRLDVAALPEQVARAFIEKDGTRGRLVYIVPAEGHSVWDAHYLIQWADAFRATKLPDGSVVKGSGRSVIFADLILTVITDAPKAIIASIVGTLLVIAVAFRFRRETLVVAATLALGIVGMVAVMAIAHTKLHDDAGNFHVAVAPMKLNFLNFVALPISIGVGADYAVNVAQRWRLAMDAKTALTEALHRTVVETGGAVILCSLTTTLGYLALTLSVNLAIVSFGVAAAAGEICCILAAVLVLPAWLVWRAKARA
jgi:hypothetical protein